mmetsp:Transcript_7754/g.11720  ORF Transcript_7754/g.11720 Transcript_7754/m.11720 type:complete len:568 (-) Transcript_7754:248-1951(-)
MIVFNRTCKEKRTPQYKQRKENELFQKLGGNVTRRKCNIALEKTDYDIKKAIEDIFSRPSSKATASTSEPLETNLSLSPMSVESFTNRAGNEATSKWADVEKLISEDRSPEVKERIKEERKKEFKQLMRTKRSPPKTLYGNLPPLPLDHGSYDLTLKSMLDCRDIFGMWLVGEVVAHSGGKVRIKYPQFEEDKYDEEIDVSHRERFAKFSRFSEYHEGVTQKEFMVGDQVRIWAPRKFGTEGLWAHAKVNKVEHYQVRVRYHDEMTLKAFDYWFHYKSGEIVHASEFRKLQRQLEFQWDEYLTKDEKNKKMSENWEPIVGEWHKFQIDGESIRVMVQEESKTKEGKKIWRIWDVQTDKKMWVRSDLLRPYDLGGTILPTNRVEEKRSNNGVSLKPSCKIVVEAGDGNCLFRCFARQFYGDTRKHPKVRKLCCKHLASNTSFFKEFKGGEKPFKKYVKDLEEIGTWGDHLSIRALQEVYNLNVEVYKSSGIRIELGKCYPQLRTVRLSHKDGNHFNSIVNSEESYPIREYPLHVPPAERINLIELRKSSEKLVAKMEQKSRSNTTRRR